MYRRILVPVDGSRTATRGLRTAIRLAAGRDTRLLLVHVVDMLQIYARLGDARNARELAAALKRAGESAIKHAMSVAARAHVHAQSVIAQSPDGRAATAIVQEARRWKADLIVMGTHGRRGLARAVVGSDAEAVIRSAPAPVLVVRAPAHEPR